MIRCGWRRILIDETPENVRRALIDTRSDLAKQYCFFALRYLKYADQLLQKQQVLTRPPRFIAALKDPSLPLAKKELAKTNQAIRGLLKQLPRSSDPSWFSQNPVTLFPAADLFDNERLIYQSVSAAQNYLSRSVPHIREIRPSSLKNLDTALNHMRIMQQLMYQV